MRNMTMAIVISLATGCSAAKGAMGLLSPKPANVTVVNVNEIKVEPAPAQVPVNVAPAPVVATVAPAPASNDAPRKSRFGSLKAAASGAVAGAVVGGVVGYAFGGTSGAGKGAAIGAGAGAVGGTLAHEIQ